MDGLTIRRTQRSRLGDLDLDRLVFGKVFSDHMFSMTHRNGAWRGPEIVPYGPIEIEPGAMTLHYAQMAFEGLKAFHGVDGRVRLFRPDRNAARMRLSCRRMCIPEIDKDDFVAAVTRLVDIDRGWISDRPGFGLYVRPVVFSAESHLEVRPSNSYRFIVMTCPVGAYFRTGETGLSLKVEDHFARTAPHGGVGETKTSANYATTFSAGRPAPGRGGRSRPKFLERVPGVPGAHRPPRPGRRPTARRDRGSAAGRQAERKRRPVFCIRLGGASRKRDRNELELAFDEGGSPVEIGDLSLGSTVAGGQPDADGVQLAARFGRDVVQFDPHRDPGRGESKDQGQGGGEQGPGSFGGFA